MRLRDRPKSSTGKPVEAVRVDVSGVRPDVPGEPEPALHVSTKLLKLQFEERLAARARRARK